MTAPTDGKRYEAGPRADEILPQGPGRPLVSVLMTSFNYGKYIGQAIRSVLEQTCPDWELVINDDGSSDGSVEVIRSFQDRRIRFLGSAPTRGACVVYNEAFAACRGQYICSLDSDDFMAPDRLARTVAFMEANPAVGVLGTHVRQVNEGDRPAGGRREFEEWFNRDVDLNGPECWVFRNHLCHSSVMMRREVHERVGAFDTGLFFTPDYDYWLRCLRAGFRFAVLAEPLTFYRSHGSNVTKQKNPERLLLEYAYLLFARLRPLLVEVGRLDLLQRACYEFFTVFYPQADADPRQRALRNLLASEGDIRFSEFLEAGAGGRLSEVGVRLLDALPLEYGKNLSRLQGWIDELDAGRRWAQEQSGNWQATASRREEIIRDLRNWVADLETGKSWLEGQVNSWRAVAEAREKELAQMQAWARQLEEDKAWWERQCHAAGQNAREWEKAVETLHAWADELETGKEWWEQQCQAARADAAQKQWRHEELDRQLTDLRQTLTASEHQRQALEGLERSTRRLASRLLLRLRQRYWLLPLGAARRRWRAWRRAG